MTTGEFSKQRTALHRSLIESGILSWSTPKGKPDVDPFVSIADGSQAFSRSIAEQIAELLERSTGVKLKLRKEKNAGQTSGNSFEAACTTFIRSTFPLIKHLRPGNWIIENIKSRTGVALSRFDQYAHLDEINKLSKKYKEVAAVLGHGYTVSPDIIIAREPETDAAINATKVLVDSSTSQYASLRRSTHGPNVTPILHANISCKFTMRSDRAQNTRTEALSLMRDRKGQVPHIVAITAEPTPSRLSSLALGTGDLDRVYHFALHELVKAVGASQNSEAIHMLDSMIGGKRLRDISDLPLDLAT
jgi:hypothetical protein